MFKWLRSDLGSEIIKYSINKFYVPNLVETLSSLRSEGIVFYCRK